jgi:hypothetical protein
MSILPQAAQALKTREPKLVRKYTQFAPASHDAVRGFSDIVKRRSLRAFLRGCKAMHERAFSSIARKVRRKTDRAARCLSAFA